MKKLLIFTFLFPLITAPAYSVKFINNSDSTLSDFFYVENDHVRHELPMNIIKPGKEGETSMQGLFEEIIHELKQQPEMANERVRIRVLATDGKRPGDVRTCPDIVLTAESNHETLDREKTFTFTGTATKWETNVKCEAN